MDEFLNSIVLLGEEITWWATASLVVLLTLVAVKPIIIWWAVCLVIGTLLIGGQCGIDTTG